MKFFELFYVFFLIGLFTIGGGYAMIPMIQSEVVSRGWADVSTVIDFIAVSESTPGPIAINMATFIGNRMGGVFGAVCATLGVVLPSFLIILLIARLFKNFKDNKYVKNVLASLRPVIIALIAFAALSVIVASFSKNVYATGVELDLKAMVIFAIILILNLFVKKIHPAVLILISAALGVLIYGFIFV